MLGMENGMVAAFEFQAKKLIYLNGLWSHLFPWAPLLELGLRKLSL